MSHEMDIAKLVKLCDKPVTMNVIRVTRAQTRPPADAPAILTNGCGADTSCLRREAAARTP